MDFVDGYRVGDGGARRRAVAGATAQRMSLSLRGTMARLGVKV